MSIDEFDAIMVGGSYAGLSAAHRSLVFGLPAAA